MDAEWADSVAADLDIFWLLVKSRESLEWIKNEPDKADSVHFSIVQKQMPIETNQ